MIAENVRKEVAFDLRLKDEQEAASPGTQGRVSQEAGPARAAALNSAQMILFETQKEAQSGRAIVKTGAEEQDEPGRWCARPITQAPQAEVGSLNCLLSTKEISTWQ